MSPDFAYPKLITPRLALRSLRREDAEFLLSEWSDPAVTDFMHDEEPLQTREQNG